MWSLLRPTNAMNARSKCTVNSSQCRQTRRSTRRTILRCDELTGSLACLVLTLPHSKADEEQASSCIGKNKWKFWTNLSLDRTLPSIVTLQMNRCVSELCFNYESSHDVCKVATHVTWQYNSRAHAMATWTLNNSNTVTWNSSRTKLTLILNCNCFSLTFLTYIAG